MLAEGDLAELEGVGHRATAKIREQETKLGRTGCFLAHLRPRVGDGDRGAEQSQEALGVLRPKSCREGVQQLLHDGPVHRACPCSVGRRAASSAPSTSRMRGRKSAAKVTTAQSTLAAMNVVWAPTRAATGAVSA